MEHKIKKWTNRQLFGDDLSVNQITKYQYGLNLDDYVYLTEFPTYKKIFEHLDTFITGDNVKLDYVSVPDKFKLGKLQQKNLIDSDLYLKVVEYNDFFLGFYTSNTQDDKYEFLDIDSFFSSIDTTFELNHDDLLDIINGFDSNSDKVLNIDEIAEKYEDMESIKLLVENILKNK